MGLETVFRPLTMTGAGEAVVETRFVVDYKVSPVALVGQVKISCAEEETIASCGRTGGRLGLAAGTIRDTR